MQGKQRNIAISLSQAEFFDDKERTTILERVAFLLRLSIILLHIVHFIALYVILLHMIYYHFIICHIIYDILQSKMYIIAVYCMIFPLISTSTIDTFTAMICFKNSFLRSS